ncbi:MAG: hypothetical protein ACR2PM_05295 [Hyphomicrobiales bacterium]
MKVIATGLIALLVLVSVWISVAAGAESCPMTYETFESAVAHIDLDECPDAVMRERSFCRVSAGGEKLHLFYFDNDGEQCLLKVESFEEDAFSLTLKPR